MNDLHARPARFDDERRDLLSRLAVLARGVGGARHDDEQFSAGPVGAPQLLAIENERLSVV